MAVFILLLCGCSKEELYPQENAGNAVGAVLSLQVSADAYRSSAGTRASESELSTTFTNGDQLGVIVTYKGKTPEHFVYTYNGSAWTSSTPVYYDNKAGYAAYYPYRKELDGKSLADVKAAFTPLTDQSDYATGYAASDLMTCENPELNQTDKKLSISLTHAFSMLRMSTSDIPVKIKCADNKTYEYQLPGTDIAFRVGNTYYRAWVDNDGYARAIVPSSSGGNSGGGNSQITVESHYTVLGKQRVKTSATVASFASGQYYTLKPPVQDLGEYRLSDARVGDFYCKHSDGRGFVIPKEISETDLQSVKDACLGIVYWVGNIKGDNYTLLDSKFQNGTHGLVVSLWDMPAPDNANSTEMYWTYGGYEFVDNWLDSKNNIQCTWTNKPTDFTSIQAADKMQGYANTLALIEYNNYVEGQSGEGYGQNGNKRVKPVKGLAAFQDAHPAPQNSSGWYWPSVKELQHVCWGQSNTSKSTAGKDMLNNQIGKLNGPGNTFGYDHYWSSTEHSGYDAWAWYVNFYDGYAGNTGGKAGSASRVRPLLAF